jgi:hypothetical protein
LDKNQVVGWDDLLAGKAREEVDPVLIPMLVNFVMNVARAAKP